MNSLCSLLPSFPSSFGRRGVARLFSRLARSCSCRRCSLGSFGFASRRRLLSASSPCRLSAFGFLRWCDLGGSSFFFRHFGRLQVLKTGVQQS